MANLDDRTLERLKQLDDDNDSEKAGDDNSSENDEEDTQELTKRGDTSSTNVADPFDEDDEDDEDVDDVNNEKEKKIMETNMFYKRKRNKDASHSQPMMNLPESTNRNKEKSSSASAVPTRHAKNIRKMKTNAVTLSLSQPNLGNTSPPVHSLISKSTDTTRRGRTSNRSEEMSSSSQQNFRSTSPIISSSSKEILSKSDNATTTKTTIRSEKVSKKHSLQVKDKHRKPSTGRKEDAMKDIPLELHEQYEELHATDPQFAYAEEMRLKQVEQNKKKTHETMSEDEVTKLDDEGQRGPLTSTPSSSNFTPRPVKLFHDSQSPIESDMDQSHHTKAKLAKLHTDFETYKKKMDARVKELEDREKQRPAKKSCALLAVHVPPIVRINVHGGYKLGLENGLQWKLDGSFDHPDNNELSKFIRSYVLGLDIKGVDNIEMAIQGSTFRYFRSKKDAATRDKRQQETPDATSHKTLQRRLERKKTKCLKRKKTLQLVQWKKETKDRVAAVLANKFMSSEESDDMAENAFKVKRYIHHSKQWRKAVDMLDAAALANTTKDSRRITNKRTPGQQSDKRVPCNDKQSWIYKQDI